MSGSEGSVRTTLTHTAPVILSGKLFAHPGELFFAEDFFQEIRNPGRRVGPDFFLLLPDNEEQSVSCLFRHVLICVECNIFGERHVLILTDQLIVLPINAHLIHDVLDVRQECRLEFL